MPRTRRYIFNTLTVVSVLLMLATVGLWVRSYFVVDVIWLSKKIIHFQGVPMDRGLSARSAIGGIHFSDGFYNLFNDPWRSSYKPHAIGVHWSQATRTPDTDFIIPHWFLTLIFAILPTIWLYKWNKRRKLGPNACPSCGYDLSGNETGVCPECGVGSTKTRMTKFE